MKEDVRKIWPKVLIATQGDKDEDEGKLEILGQ